MTTDEVAFNAKASTVEVAAHYRGGSVEAETELLGRAAKGEVEAQRVFVEAMTGGYLVEDEARESFLAAAEIFARMAASHGFRGDRRRLAGVLTLSAGQCRSAARPEAATSLETECLLILNQLAEEGDEESAQSMNALAEEFSEDAVKAAREEAKAARVQVVCIAPPPVEVPAITWAEPVGFAARLEDLGWSVRFYFQDVWFALCGLGRALVGRI